MNTHFKISNLNVYDMADKIEVLSDVGATGGTVTLPGVGTVAGAVGGAVFGFAGGYVGGALSSIAGSLIATCFRKEVRTQPSILCEDLKYAINNMRECYPELNDRKLNYYLTR